MNKARQKGKRPSIQYFLRFEWYLLFSIVAGELFLAYSIPPNILSEWSILETLVNLLQNVAPVLGKITAESADHPETIRFYVALTLCLVPVKAWLFFHWINSKHLAIYRFLVVSPLLDQKPASGDYFVLEPLRRERGIAAQGKPRSMFSRIFWSSLVLVLTALGVWVILRFFPPPGPTPDGGDEAYRALVAEGTQMWSSWSLKLLTFESFLLAISSSILRDYRIFFKNKSTLKGKIDE